MQTLFVAVSGNHGGCIRLALARYVRMQLVDQMVLFQEICYELGARLLEFDRHPAAWNYLR